MALALVLGLIGVPAITAIETAGPAYASTCGSPVSGGTITCDNLGYPWVDATYVDANYDWGYNPCPSSDTNCMTKVISGYGVYDPWDYYLRNCTSYIAWQLAQYGVPADDFNFASHSLGNASQWLSDAQSSTWKQLNGLVSTNKNAPQLGAVAVNTTAAEGYGHVMFVTGIAYNSDGSVKNITVQEYNYAGTGVGDIQTATPAALGINGYIYYASLMTNPPSWISGGVDSTANYSGNFATSWGTGRLDIFTAKDYSGPNVAHLYYDGNWQPWDSLGPLTKQVASWPAAVSWGVGRIDVFARGTSNDLLHAYYDANGWHDWTSLGGCIKGAPGASTWGTDRLDVFAEGCSSNNLEHIWYNGAWQPWETLSLAGATLDGSPAAVSWGVGRIDVFARANNGTLIQTYDDASGWHPWANFGGCITGAPSVSSWGVNRLDVFAQGCPANGSVNHIWFDGSWHPWETLPYATSITTSFGAVSWGVGRIDVFGLAPNGDLMQQYDDASGWHPWADLGQP